MSGEHLEALTKHYDITMEEAERRIQVVEAQGGDPEDPICIGCAKRPAELDCYDIYLADEDEPPADLAEFRKRMCLQEEGTLNPENGHFLCDECYIRNGQPSSPRGWKAP